MATIANLSIGLSANSARLSKDLDKAKRKTKRWSQSMKKMAGGVAVAFAGIAASLGTRALVANADALSKNSKALGMNIEAYQRLRFGIGQAGISQTGFEKGIRKMNGVILDAGLGLKTSIDSLKMLGLTYEDLMKMPVEERFLAINKGLEGIGDNGTRAAVAMDVYGKEFADVHINTVQLIKDGKDIAVVNQTAATAAEVFTDAMSALGATIQNTMTNVLEPFMNQITDIADGWRDLVLDFPNVVKWIGRITTAFIGLNLVMMANPIGAMIVAVGLLIVAVGKLYNYLNTISEATGSISNSFALMGDAVKFEFERMLHYGERMSIGFQLIANDIKDKFQIMFHDIMIQMATLLDKMPLSKGGNEDAARVRATNDMRATTDEWVMLMRKKTDNALAVSEANPFLAELKGILFPAVTAIEDAVTGSAPFKLTAGKTDDEPSIGEGDGSYFTDIATDFSDTLKTSLTDAFKTGDFSAIGDMVLGKITDSIISKSIGQAVDFGMSFLGFSDGGMVPSTPNSKSYADSVPAMLTPGELVVPKSQVDNFLNGSGGSGGGQTFNINVTGDVSRLTRKEIAKMMPEIAAGTNMLNKENNIK